MSEPTAVRIVYDDDAIYLGARLAGPVRYRLGRRDMDLLDSDWFGVAFDSYHDHRTAFHFQVNPGGVERDAALVTLEAMKMENELRAPARGRVAKLAANEGSKVEGGAVLAVIVIGTIGWVIARPAVAAYLLIFLTPLVVGINAGAVIPVLRPNEALIVLFGAAVGLRWLAGVRTGDIRWPRMDRVDASLIALGVTTSVLPLMMMVVRQRPISADDLLYCIVMWKLLAEYVIVRTVISTREQAMRCLWLSMLAAAIVCAVGIVQSLGLADVPGLLAKYYAPVGVDTSLSNGRGGCFLGPPASAA